MKKLILVVLISVCSLLAWGQNKVDAQLWAQLQTGGSAEVMVIMQQQADLAPARQMSGKVRRGQYVYEQTQALADRSQMQVRALLTSAGVPYRSFAIVNALYTTLDRAMAERLAALPEVGFVAPNPWTKLDEPELDRTPMGQRNTIEWGILKIRADEVWNQGNRGEGVVVGGADTGYDWDHPALINQYRGYTNGEADHNYNWHDAIHAISPLHQDSIVSPDNNPCGLDSTVPCDDNNHGTHTMGTIVGDDGGENQIGVAPAAQWIGCRNMERGWGSPASYIECFQWFLAPTDLNNENPDPALAPHVINNSWGCPAIEGCTPENWDIMRQAIENLRMAGVVVVVSAGNDGPNCNTIANAPAIFEESFSVGATRQNDTIAGFSSRGLVLADSSLRLKPNVVAPGVQVRSAIRNGGYATFNGTSQAGPHVAGAVALMIAAAPELAGDVATIENVLEETAVPKLAEVDCGVGGVDPVPNATYGYGRINALAAVEAAQTIVATHEEVLATIQLQPNPTTGIVTIQMNGESGELTLYDSQGRPLLRRNIPADSSLPLDIGYLVPGMYVYTIQTPTGVVTGKLVLIK